MMDHKRSSIHIDAPCCITTSSLAPKRHKPMSSAAITKENNKDKFGERISALQQIVSPYGKTDTASVLLEAMEYIQFLHDQLKVLSAPYLQTTHLVKMQMQKSVDMRSRGLCLVPVSSAVGVASNGNGADIWAPVNSSSLRY